MESIAFNLYRNNFDIESNQSCLGRGVRTIIIIALFFLLLKFYPNINVYFSVAIFLVLLYFSDKYLRKLYPDWPKQKNFIGKISFLPNKIEIKYSETLINLEISECKEFLIFWDHYVGYAKSGGDIERNGNALLYFEDQKDNSQIAKFNVQSKEQMTKLKIILQEYKENISYFKEYLPSEIKYILTADLSRRIKYKKHH